MCVLTTQRRSCPEIGDQVLQFRCRQYSVKSSAQKFILGCLANNIATATSCANPFLVRKKSSTFSCHITWMDVKEVPGRVGEKVGRSQDSFGLKERQAGGQAGRAQVGRGRREWTSRGCSCLPVVPGVRPSAAAPCETAKEGSSFMSVSRKRKTFPASRGGIVVGGGI